MLKVEETTANGVRYALCRNATGQWFVAYNYRMGGPDFQDCGSERKARDVYKAMIRAARRIQKLKGKRS